MNSRSFVTALTSLLLISLASFPEMAILSAQGRSKKENEARKKLEPKALTMLNELIKEAGAFELLENRLRVLAFSADRLWPYDEDRARDLFNQSIDIFHNISRQPNDSSTALPGDPRRDLPYMRMEVGQMLARHDPQLAIGFVAASRPAAEKNSLGYYDATWEILLETVIAEEIANKDPKLALQVIRERSEGRGDMVAYYSLYDSLFKLLSTVREKDFDAAKEATNSIIANLRSVRAFNRESAVFTIKLITYMSPPLQPEKGKSAPADQRKSLLTRTEIVELIEKVVFSAQAELAATNGLKDSVLPYFGSFLVDELEPMMPYIEKYAPDSATAAKLAITELEQLRKSSQLKLMEFNSLPNMSSGEPHKEQDWPGLEQLLQESIVHKNYGETRRLLGKLPADLKHPSSFITVAMWALADGQKKIASQLLDDAWARVDGRVETNLQLNAQLSLAEAYLRLNPARSFEIIESTLDRYNDKFAGVGGPESGESFRENEMILLDQIIGRRDTPNACSFADTCPHLSRYSNCLAKLAQTDFDRVNSLISRFTRYEARAKIRMAVLRELLPIADTHK